MWACQQTGNPIRGVRRSASGGLARRDARTILAAAPTPAHAAKLTPARLREVFTAAYLHQPAAVQTAMGIQLTAPLGQFDAASTAAEEFAEAANRPF